jgi:hypothetical protein
MGTIHTPLDIPSDHNVPTVTPQQMREVDRAIGT